MSHRDDVRDLYLEGHSVSQIVKMTGIPADRVRKWCHDILRPYALAVRLANGHAVTPSTRGHDGA